MDQTAVLPESRRQEILTHLQEERAQRRRSVQSGEEYHIDWDSLRTSTTSQRKPEANRVRSEDFSHQSASSLKLKSHPSSPLFSPRSPALSLKSTTIRSHNSSLKGVTSAPGSRGSSRTREMDVERIRAEVEQQWTFQPNAKKERKQAWGMIAPVDVLASEFEEKWDKLSTPKTKVIAERERQRVERENQEVEKCTFHPQISECRVRREGRVEERLFGEAVVRAKERQRLRVMNEEYEAAECTFRPRTHGGSPRTPIYQRLTSIVQQRDRELEALRARISSQEQSVKTYHPAINPTSAALAHTRSLKEGLTAKDVVSRMEAETLRSEWRKVLLMKAHEQSLLKDCSFSPRMHPELPFNHATISSKVKTMSLDDEAYPFHPLIDSKSRELSARSSRLSWDQRLPHRDVDKQAAAQHRASLGFRQTHTFVPQSYVSNPSLQSVQSRYRLPAKRATSDVEQKNPALFKPVLVSSLRQGVKSVYGAGEDVSENIAKYTQDRQRRMEQFRKMREVEEAEKCPFFPATTNCTPRNSKSPPVKGLESFFEHMDRANRLKVEAKQREEAVFKPSPRPRNYYVTVPKPFSFQ